MAPLRARCPNEPLAISVSLEVEYCGGTDTACWDSADNARPDPGAPARTVTVDRPCIETHAPTVRDQLVMAGVRLAGLPSRVLGE